MKVNSKANIDDYGSINQLSDGVVNPEKVSQQVGEIPSPRFRRSIFSCTSSHNKRFRSVGKSGILSIQSKIIKIFSVILLFLFGRIRKCGFHPTPFKCLRYYYVPRMQQ